MHVIIIYDVSEKRCSKIHKLLKRYLDWVQNSVFEGEITKSDLVILKSELSQRIDEKTDSVIIYNLRNTRWIDRSVLGKERNIISNFI